MVFAIDNKFAEIAYASGNTPFRISSDDVDSLGFSPDGSRAKLRATADLWDHSRLLAGSRRPRPDAPGLADRGGEGSEGHDRRLAVGRRHARVLVAREAARRGVRHDPVTAEQLLSAIASGDRPLALRLAQAHPELAQAGVACAAALGDADALSAALAADATLAVTVDERGWTPLLYACAGPLPAADCVALLLDHGADPNTYMLHDAGDPDSRIPALYFACIANQPPVVRLLLERGADPNDGESIYHAAELNHRECLELLLAHGADISSAHSAVDGNTPLYFLAGYARPPTATRIAGMRWLLEHGADPNVPSRSSELADGAHAVRARRPIRQPAGRGAVAPARRRPVGARSRRMRSSERASERTSRLHATCSPRIRALAGELGVEAAGRRRHPAPPRGLAGQGERGPAAARPGRADRRPRHRVRRLSARLGRARLRELPQRRRRLLPGGRCAARRRREP